MANYRVFGTNVSNIIHIGFWKGKLQVSHTLFSENNEPLYYIDFSEGI